MLGSMNTGIPKPPELSRCHRPSGPPGTRSSARASSGVNAGVFWVTAFMEAGAVCLRSRSAKIRLAITLPSTSPPGLTGAGRQPDRVGRGPGSGPRPPRAAIAASRSSTRVAVRTSMSGAGTTAPSYGCGEILTLLPFDGLEEVLEVERPRRAVSSGLVSQGLLSSAPAPPNGRWGLGVAMMGVPAFNSTRATNKKERAALVRSCLAGRVAHWPARPGWCFATSPRVVSSRLVGPSGSVRTREVLTGAFWPGLFAVRSLSADGDSSVLLAGAGDAGATGGRQWVEPGCQSRYCHDRRVGQLPARRPVSASGSTAGSVSCQRVGCPGALSCSRSLNCRPSGSPRLGRTSSLAEV